MCCQGCFCPLADLVQWKKTQKQKQNEFIFELLPFLRRSDNFSLSFGLSSVKWEEQDLAFGMSRR